MLQANNTKLYWVHKTIIYNQKYNNGKFNNYRFNVIYEAKLILINFNLRNYNRNFTYNSCCIILLIKKIKDIN